MAPSSNTRLPGNRGWRRDLINSWAVGETPSYVTRGEMRRRGIPETPAGLDLLTVAKNLLGAGFLEGEVHKALQGQLSETEISRHGSAVPEMLSETLDAHAAGMSVVEISDALGVTRPWVYYHLNLRKLDPNVNRAKELSARQQKQVVHAYLEGVPMADIARRFQVTYDQVRYAVKDAG